MNFDVMKTFCDLVDSGSFSKAAEMSFISQSAVSQQLAKLEQELATQLINRGAGAVSPTAAGQAFYEGAREILRRYEQMVGQVRSARDSVRGVLRVGTIYSVGFYLLDPFVRKFLQTCGDVRLHVQYTGWNRIYTSVISGEMDLGVVACPERHRFIEIVPLASEDLVMVCSPRHRLAKKTTVVPQDLEGEDFVGFETSIPTRRFIDRLLRSQQVSVKILMEFDNVELLKRAVEVDSGISILPVENVRREVEYGDLACVRFKNSLPWKRPVAIIRRRGQAPGPAEKMFLAILRSPPGEDSPAVKPQP